MNPDVLVPKEDLERLLSAAFDAARYIEAEREENDEGVRHLDICIAKVRVLIPIDEELV